MPQLTSLLRNEDNAFWQALAEWHAGLDADRGQRAALRRAKTVNEVLLCGAYHRGLVYKLLSRDITLNAWELERLALPVGVLAHADALTSGTPTARLLATAEHADADVRDIRFRRLLAIGEEPADRDRLFTACIRLVRYLDGRIEPRSFVIGTYRWNDRAKKDWARHYYLSDKAA